jgi:hypothetical protein
MDSQRNISVPTAEEDKGLLIIGSEIDDSVEWLDIPQIGRRNVITVSQMRCPHCRVATHNTAYLGTHKGKGLYTVNCPKINQFIVYKMEIKNANM